MSPSIRVNSNGLVNYLGEKCPWGQRSTLETLEGVESLPEMQVDSRALLSDFCLWEYALSCEINYFLHNVLCVSYEFFQQRSQRETVKVCLNQALSGIFTLKGSLSSRHISVVHMDNGKIKEKFEKCQTSPLALRYWLFNISCTILSCRTTLLKVKNIASVKLQINSHVFGSRTFEIAINFL